MKYYTYQLCVYEDRHDKIYLNKEGHAYYIDKLGKKENGETLLIERIRAGTRFSDALRIFFREIQMSYPTAKEKGWHI